MRKLSELSTGDVAYIAKVQGRGAFQRRMGEMGFIKGKEIKVIKNAPLLDPIEYSILDYNVSLRRTEAAFIFVSKEQAVNGTYALKNTHPVPAEKTTVYKLDAKGKSINVALIGNPNAGKTSIFNFASHSNEHTGNYAGVTIDSKTAQIEYNGYLLNITDLPGTYSLSTFSPEELYVRNFIINQMPDVIINVVDASNLERNFYLTTQIIDMDVKVIIALNMYDELINTKAVLDYYKLGELLGIPIVPTIGSKGKGMKELVQEVISMYNDIDPIYRHIHINYGDELEKSISQIQKYLKQPSNFDITDRISSRYIALKLLENDKNIGNHLKTSPDYTRIKEVAQIESQRIRGIYEEDAQTVITDAKYGFISGALKETYTKGNDKKREHTEIIDAFVTHKLFGFPIFFGFLWLMFTATFVLGGYPMNWIESGVAYLSELIHNNMTEGSFKDLLVDGVIGGVGGVIVFLPNILLLFLFISFLEDSGYMARAVFIMDRIMHRIGLHGKSFISLVMGFGCNVPAIMSTRTIEDKKNRMLTILINPFMSCSARLPVYLLIIGAIFPTHRGSILFSVYLFGIIMAVVMALVFKKTLFRGEDTPFVMELPPYRMPTLRSVTRHMWSKGSQYLKKMGGIILLASIILWALGYFPRKIEHSKELLSAKASIENSILISGKGLLEDSLQATLLNDNLVEINRQLEAERLENSYIGRIGKFIEPAIKPLGFDWKMGISLFSGVAAKEVVVSTFGVLYQAGEENSEQKLIERIRNEKYESGEKKGEKVFTTASSMAFIMFTLLYFPCIAVIASVRRETGKLWWAIFMMAYTTALAWIMAFLVYNGLNIIK